MIYTFDIDDTLCKTENGNFVNAKPMEDRIAKVNQLYHEGHEIILHTARGTMTGINWEKLTKKQLTQWGVKYNLLLFKKPHSDFYIDDKGINANDFFK